MPYHLATPLDLGERPGPEQKLRPFRLHVGWVKGFEPSTPGTTIRCSNQLSYTHHITDARLHLKPAGTPGGTRTPGPLLRRQLLYPPELQAHLERVMGIEPTRPAWKAGILPLNYTRMDGVPLTSAFWILPHFFPPVNGFLKFFSLNAGPVSRGSPAVSGGLLLTDTRSDFQPSAASQKAQQSTPPTFFTRGGR